MKMSQYSSHWPQKRFPSFYKEHRRFLGVEITISHMKELIGTDVVEHGLVHEGFLHPYLTLVDALQKLTEALFELCPKGVVRFELTKEGGLKMLFRTDMSSDGRIFTMIDIGWVYANQVSTIVAKSIEQGSEKYQQLAHGYLP